MEQSAASTIHDTDSILASLGVGRWQCIQVITLILFFIPWAMQSMGILILGFVPDFACLPPDSENLSEYRSQNLSYGQTCTWHNATSNTSSVCSGGFVYAEPKEASIVSEWDLVCGYTYLSDLSQTIYTAGFSVGTIIFTLIADKYGRRNAIFGSNVALLCASFVNCLAINITTFIIARFCLGAFIGAAGMVSWVLMLELFLPQHRTKAALTANVVWSISTCTLPALGYLMKGYNWRYVQLTVSSISLIVIGQFVFVDESVRWLLTNRRVKEATRITRKAARLNGVKSEKILPIISRHLSVESNKGTCLNSIQTNIQDKKTPKSNEKTVISDNNNKTNVSPLALIKHPTMRRITLIMFLAWFTNALTYTGIYMLSSTMSGDRYLNLFLTTAAEVPASIILFPVMLKYPRRKILILLHLLAGVSLITAAVVHTTTEGHVGYITLLCVTLMGKFGISGTFNLIFLYTPELFPTNIRSIGVGATTVSSRVGALLSPFAATVAREVPWVPSAVFGGLCLLVALVCPLFPETRGKDLPETLEDVDKLYLQDKPQTKKDIALKECIKTHL